MSDDLLTDDPLTRKPWYSRWFARRPRGAAGSSGTGGHWSWHLIKWIAIVVALVVVLYYPIGMVLTHKINDDPDFAAPPVDAGASQSVAIAAALMDREINQTAWPANDPFFMPGWALDNMPNFQRGIMAALGRFSTELMDQLGRTRGSSQTDRDLEQARGFLNEQPNIWIWQPSVSFWPSATSAQKYRAGRDKLIAYNKRLASGQAVIERR